MIVVIGSFRLPPESVAAGRGAMARVIAASRAEPGCLAYTYAEDVLEPGLFRVGEIWENRAALAAHFATPHMEQWQRERAELGMSGREVTGLRGERPGSALITPRAAAALGRAGEDAGRAERKSA